MRPDGADLLVVLAMHVVCNRAAERDELGAGHDWREPTVRHGQAQQSVEGEPRLRTQHSLFAVETHDPVQLVGDDQPPAFVEADIAIGPAHAETELGSALPGREALCLVEEGRPRDLMRHARQPPPGRNMLHAPRSSTGRVLGRYTIDLQQKLLVLPRHRRLLTLILAIRLIPRTIPRSLPPWTSKRSPFPGLFW